MLPIRFVFAFLAALLSFCAACAAPRRGTDPRQQRCADQGAIDAVLTDWHDAASQADGVRYFGHMAEDAVFLGTDASERWPMEAFRAFCEPYFSRGVGWTYACRERHVFVEGALAWFDERLWNDKYGDCRGTGALRRSAGEWRIVHYSLALLVPNERAADVVRVIRGE